MEQFYFIVLITASVILILLLTFIGILLYSSTTATKFPPANNICPDYWLINPDKTCQFPQIMTGRNQGKLASSISNGVTQITDKSTLPFLTTDKKSIDFSKGAWASLYPSTTANCAKKKWAIDNGIEWDGYSNSYNC